MPHTSWTHWDKSRETRYQENSIQRRIQKALPYDTKSLGPLLCSLVHIGAPWTLWKKMCPGTSSRGVSAGVPLAGRLCKTDSPMGLVLSLYVWQRTLLVQFPFNLFFPVCLALSKLCLFDVVPIYLPYQLSDPLQKRKIPFSLSGDSFCSSLITRTEDGGCQTDTPGNSTGSSHWVYWPWCTGLGSISCSFPFLLWLQLVLPAQYLSIHFSLVG